MTISELVEFLQRRLAKHGDIEVEITWESITYTIVPSAIYKSKKGPLLIDADDNFYKHDFALDPTEGEEEEEEYYRREFE
jgi:hypothetical protein